MSIAKIEPSDLVNQSPANRYHLRAAEKMAELERFASMPAHIGADDVSLLRMTVADLANEGGREGLLIKAADALTKATAAFEASQIKRGELVDRSQVAVLASRIVSIVMDVLEPMMKPEDYLDAVDAIVEQVRQQFLGNNQ